MVQQLPKAQPPLRAWQSLMQVLPILQPPARLPTVTIIEQPAAKSLRFRYKCESEGRSVGSLVGVNSTAEKKTYPTIRIDNFTGQVTIVVSCVTKDMPYRPHPNNLVGRDQEQGVITIRDWVMQTNNEFEFKHLGVQCVKRKGIAESLKKRAELRVDPFSTGFKHTESWKSIDVSAIRLAFQVFLHDPQDADKLTPLKPVVSDVIQDKKTPDLHISSAIGCSSPVTGKMQIGLLCEKVSREDTVVMVYEEDKQGNTRWETRAHTVLVHKQVVIVFETPTYNPPYYDPRTHQGSIILNIQLKRISDSKRSNSVKFEYIPDGQEWTPKRRMHTPPASPPPEVKVKEEISSPTSRNDTFLEAVREWHSQTDGEGEFPYASKPIWETHSPKIEVGENSLHMDTQSPYLCGVGGTCSVLGTSRGRSPPLGRTGITRPVLPPTVHAPTGNVTGAPFAHTSSLGEQSLNQGRDGTIGSSQGTYSSHLGGVGRTAHHGLPSIAHSQEPAATRVPYEHDTRFAAPRPYPDLHLPSGPITYGIIDELEQMEVSSAELTPLLNNVTRASLKDLTKLFSQNCESLSENLRRLSTHNH